MACDAWSLIPYAVNSKNGCNSLKKMHLKTESCSLHVEYFNVTSCGQPGYVILTF